MTRTKAYPGLDRPPPSHISEIIRDDHPRDPDYPMFEELAGEDLLILDDLRSHREEIERARKEDEDKSRLLLAGMLRKEETFSRRELVDFARDMGIEVVADDQGTGTARTRKIKELEKAKEQRDAVERACHIESEVKRPSRKSSKKPRSSGPRWDPSYDNLELDEDQDTSRQELVIEHDEPKRKQTRTSKVLPLNKTDAATSVTRPMTRSSRKGEDEANSVPLAIVPEACADREIKLLPKRASLVPIGNSTKVYGRIQLTPQRKRFLESVAEKPVFYHPDGKVRNLKAHERKSLLQEDEWTASVTPFSFECEACGSERALDSRSALGYDFSLWIKHRKTCRPMYAAWLKKNRERDDTFDSTIET
ncbi:hypothetical protein EDD18DRAFT_1387680 [Armillaria luteobubalina]|uniref:Uncharacterized protein n=1 Tax=Armillaria luteobubalina TaxID=153913 RepID=A0AA39UEG6_9AGAR|nr:hypothetical protein EDD18DRAFT_1387680 [Armillaria luteobubalina]